MSSPGPWEATDLEGEGSVDGSWAVFPKADAPVGVAQGAIAEVYAEPDALLMARAPEMLEALQRVYLDAREGALMLGGPVRQTHSFLNEEDIQWARKHFASIAARIKKLLAEVDGE